MATGGSEERAIFKWRDDGKYYIIKPSGETESGPYNTVEDARANVQVTEPSVDWASARSDGEIAETFGGNKPRSIQLREELAALDETTEERLAREEIRIEEQRMAGRARGEEIFGEGSLGRISEETPSEIMGLLDERRALQQEQRDMGQATLDTMSQQSTQLTEEQQLERQRRDLMTQEAQQRGQQELGLRDTERLRVTQEFDDLIRGRLDPTSQLRLSQQEAGLQGIQDQYRQNVTQARTLANLGNQKMIGALEAEALRESARSRMQLERDLAIDSMMRAEQLTADAAQLRNLNLAQREQLVSNQIAREDALQQASESLQLAQTQQRAEDTARRAQVEFQLGEQQSAQQQRFEDIHAAIRQDQLNRQLINMQSASNELFGRLSTEEGMVAQGIAARAGITQEVLAQSNLAEQRRHQLESEEIQRIEANKEPPSSGGGKSIMCVAVWQKGGISDEVLKGDFEYCKRYIDDDTRRGYFWLSTPVAQRIVAGDTDSWWYKAFEPLTAGWANEMSHRMGGPGYSSVWGKILCAVGVPLCRTVGAALRWCGQTDIANDGAKEILRHAAHLDVDLEEDMDRWLAENKPRAGIEEVA